MKETVVIIGFGPAAVNAAIALRFSGYSGGITVLNDRPGLPYSPIMASAYAASTISANDMHPWDSADLAALELDLHEQCPAIGLDIAAHEVDTPNGPIPYDKLIIASGAAPITHGFPAPTSCPMLTLRTPEDAERLAALAAPGSRILISGTSLVALKALEACMRRGARTTLLGRSEHIMRRIAPAAVAARFEDALKAAGSELLLGSEIVSAHMESERYLAEFSNGATASYDAVLVAHGMAPRLDFVPEGSLRRETGLIVDGFMRTSSPDVYAAGDVAQVPNLITGTSAVAGLWKESCLQGAIAGRTVAAELAGTRPGGRPYAGFVPNNVVTVGDIVASCGGSVQGEVCMEEHPWGCVATIHAEDGRMVGYAAFSPDAREGDEVFDHGAMLLNRLKQIYMP